MEKNSSGTQRMTFEKILKKLRNRHYGVLSTISKDGRSHSVSVMYGISTDKRSYEIYVMTRKKLKKARNIELNNNISFVVPLTRRFLTILPPPSIQFQGKAEIIDWKDEIGVRTFKSFFMGRRVLKMYDEAYHRGERTICFIRITPDPIIFTYMVGYSIWEMRRRMESGIEKIEVPNNLRRNII